MKESGKGPKKGNYKVGDWKGGIQSKSGAAFDIIILVLSKEWFQRNGGPEWAFPFLGDTLPKDVLF